MDLTDEHIQCNQCVDFDATNESIHDSIFDKTTLGSEKPNEIFDSLKKPSLWSPQRQPLRVHKSNAANTESREPVIMKDISKRIDDAAFKLPKPVEVAVPVNPTPSAAQKPPSPTALKSPSPLTETRTTVSDEAPTVNSQPDVRARIADKILTPTVNRASYSKSTASSQTKENPVKIKSFLHSKSSARPPPRSSISSAVRNLPPQPRERTNSNSSNGSRGSTKVNLERIMAATKSSTLRMRSSSGEPLPNPPTMRARSSSGSQPASMRTRTSSAGSTESEKRTIKISRASLENLARPRTASVGLKSSDDIVLENAETERKELARLRSKNMAALQNLKLAIPPRVNRGHNGSATSVTTACTNDSDKKVKSIYERTPVTTKPTDKPTTTLKGLPPRQPAHVTQPKPFDFLIDKRGELQQQKFKQKVEEEEKLARELALHHARPADVLKRKPYMIKPSDKLPTAPLNIQFYSEGRAQDRQKLNEKMAVIEAQKAEILAQRRIIQAELDREEMKKLRQATVLKPEPILKYKPVVIHKSERPLTMPRSPALQTKTRFNSGGSRDEEN